MGDGGAYSLSFLLGYILITIYNKNQIVSPILLLFCCGIHVLKIFFQF